MKKVNLLSKAEMRNVMGGVIDAPTFLQVCLDNIYKDFGDDPIANEIILQMQTNLCYEAYNNIPQ